MPGTRRTHPLLIGHRGFTVRAPENTLVAIREAFAAGVDGCEVDVRLSADGVPVLSHDATVDRCTNGTGAVAQKTAAELGALDAGSWKYVRYRGEPVPTLEAAFEVAAPRGFLLLDLKHAGQAAAIVPLVRRLGVVDRVIAGVWDAADALNWRELAPEIPCFLIGKLATPLPEGFFTEMLTGNIRGFNYFGGTLERSFVHAAHCRAMPVYAWTLNKRDEMERAVGLGVDAILTDDPELGAEVLDEIGARPKS